MEHREEPTEAASGACEYPSRDGRVRERTVVKIVKKPQPPRPHSCSSQAVTRKQAHEMPAGRPGGALAAPSAASTAAVGATLRRQ